MCCYEFTVYPTFAEKSLKLITVADPLGVRTPLPSQECLYLIITFEYQNVFRLAGAKTNS